MTPADHARAMGDYIREHGFSPYYHRGTRKLRNCGCFYHAIEAIAGGFGDGTLSYAIEKVIGLKYLGAEELIAAGYASDADRDKAVEACYAAARLLEAAE